ncbi:hypothetical protein BDW59DRAFT_158273 [Aspergillus cavernicola]|uniref:Uncharacterized protein n=1 Tax=Aspergillus cavernicola TaxID=176166 RepID=A0ABR4IVH4_9EURO
MAALIANPLIVPVLPTELSYASPGIQDPTSLFGPRTPSIRSRRSDGSSSDETPVPTADGFLETDLRAGGPQLCESPCETLRKIPRSHTNYTLLQGPGSYQLLTQLGDICHGENVRYSDMIFCGRRSVYEPNDDPIVTLLVTAGRCEAQSSWISLTRMLSNHLRGRGLQRVSVEIMDPKLMQRPKIHPCLPSDPIFPIWTQVATDIFNGINRAGVFTVGCFRIGSDYDRHQCPPTVLLGVDRKVKRDWKQLREVVITILDRHNLHAVAVTIRKDNKIISDGDPDDTGAKVQETRSVYNSQGTLGGWVDVMNPQSGDWLSFAITCSHCCFPAENELSVEDCKVIREWKQCGVHVGDAHKARLLPIDSPSFCDMNKGVESIAAEIERLKSDSVYRQVEELKAKDEIVLPHLERSWEYISKSIIQQQNEHHDMRDFFNSNTYRLGTVFAASGLREAKSTDNPKKLSIRDWALVQPATPRSAGNNMVMLSPFQNPRGLSQLHGFHTGLPNIDEKLFKIGCATGYTHGVYGNLKSCLIVTKLSDGKKVDIETFEHVVIQPGHTVVKEGDSGSLIFASNGLVLGMIFGGSGNNDLGYFTPTRDLLVDIKYVTGAKDIRLRCVE